MDSALITAVELSNRYITSRYLPDKAIDVIDEACSSTRIQLDSQPLSIDILERRKLQLEVEATALEREKNDPLSKERLIGVKEELLKIEEELKPLKKQYLEERSSIDEITRLQKKRDELRIKLEQAERTRDLQRQADIKVFFYQFFINLFIQYGALPDITQQIEKLIKKKEIEESQHLSSSSSEKALLRETITPQIVCEIIAKSTGIPIERLNQSERQKILKLEDTLKKRIIGQDKAISAICDCILRSRAGLSRANQPTGSFLFLGPTGTGKTYICKQLALELLFIYLFFFFFINIYICF
jgi:ATP-dependent Clp protease ATP-binding subunit ClpB